MVPGSKYLIPYESQHHQESADFPGTILSKQVGFIYQKAGFILDKKNVELPDYIGNELAFAGILLKKASKKGGSDDTSASYYHLYSEFLKDHLLMWIPVFSEKMQEKSSSVFFKVWGIFLEQFIREERDLVFNMNG
jgi:TorA maturation chaperone TorD